VFHKYNEVYLYWSMLDQEVDEGNRRIWELHLNMEIGQLQEACRFLREYEGTEAQEILPAMLPDTPLVFEENKEYVREILATQYNLRTDGLEYVEIDDLPSDHRYFAFQAVMNGDGVPSEQVVNDDRAESGQEYRDETDGDNPIEELRPVAASS
jgi:hypothetical protein